MEPYQHTVQYYETDKMGIVHHSNYIRWFEEARIDWMRHCGISYREMEKQGIIVTVLGDLAILTCLGVHYPWLTIGIPAIPSLYFDWFSGCIQAFIFCTLTTLFIKQAAG